MIEGISFFTVTNIEGGGVSKFSKWFITIQFKYFTLVGELLQILIPVPSA